MNHHPQVRRIDDPCPSLRGAEHESSTDHDPIGTTRVPQQQPGCGTSSSTAFRSGWPRDSWRRGCTRRSCGLWLRAPFFFTGGGTPDDLNYNAGSSGTFDLADYDLAPRDRCYRDSHVPASADWTRREHHVGGLHRDLVQEPTPSPKAGAPPATEASVTRTSARSRSPGNNSEADARPRLFNASLALIRLTRGGSWRTEAGTEDLQLRRPRSGTSAGSFRSRVSRQHVTPSTTPRANYHRMLLPVPGGGRRRTPLTQQQLRGTTSTLSLVG
jgi:hypothetical protein